MRKRGRDLERPNQSKARDRCRRRASDLASVEQDLTRGRREKVREQIETGRLARSVRSDQSVNGAAANVEIDAIDGDEAFELLGESAGLQDDLIGHVRSRSTPARRASPRSVARLSGTGERLAI